MRWIRASLAPPRRTSASVDAAVTMSPPSASVSWDPDYTCLSAYRKPDNALGVEDGPRHSS